MFNANPVGWFEIPVLDMNRAKHFYRSVFNIEFEMLEMGPQLMAMFPFDHSQPGASGALIQGPEDEPCDRGTTVYFECADVALLLNKVEHAGGKLLQAKMSIGEYGFIGAFLDSEGNKVALHSQQ